MRALLAAALVFLVGAALGGVGFTLEQHYLVWHPSVTRVAGGWRIAGQPGLGVGAPVMGGDHLAWSQGPYICVLDLGSGKTTVIDVAPVGGADGSLVASDRYIAWFQQHRDGSSALWAYDTVSGRRWQVAAQVGAPSFGQLAMAGSLLATLYPDGSRIVGIDLASGHSSVLARGVQSNLPPLLGDHVVGWVLPSAAAVLTDPRSGRTTTLELAPSGGSGLEIVAPQLVGRRLLWAQQNTTSRQAALFTYDIDGAATATVAEGAITDPVLGSDLIAWVQPATTGPGDALMGCRISSGLGPVLTLGRTSELVAGLALGGTHIAWLVDTGRPRAPYIQTATVPR